MCTWQWIKEISPIVAAWATAAACVIALFVAFLPHILAWWRRPRVRVEYEDKLPYRRKALPGDGKVTEWVRIWVINNGRSTLKGCIAKVLEIRDDNGEKVDFDPTLLRWVRCSDKSIDLKRKEGDYLNILYAEKDEDHIHIDVAELPKGFPYECPREADYYLTITFYGENIEPTSYKLYFQGKGHPEYDKFEFRKKAGPRAEIIGRENM